MYSHFTDRTNEAQRYEVTCQKSHHEIMIHYCGGGGGLTIAVDLI